MTRLEFSRPRRLDTIGEGTATVRIEADADERAALARRFGLLSLDRLSADYSLRREAAGVRAHGRVSAAVVQPCIASGDPVPEMLDEPFDVLFLPEPDAAADEVELDEGDLDTMFYTGGTIDLGEAAAETLALALDPYPRSPGAADALRGAGVLSEDEAKPKGALAGLKDLLARGD